ncbi:hypothetical protein K438DRAFT_1960039 [Mycena galopus ATCC 62051]|nr:hypothetical protein K438DRAFT_1960039 [Mycena galopus ATCC 62051]
MFHTKKLNLLLEQIHAVQYNEVVLLNILRKCSNHELLTAGVESARLWKAVAAVLQSCGDASAERYEQKSDKLLVAQHSGPMPRLFSALPAELRLAVLEMLNVCDLMAVAATCKFLHSLCNTVLDRHMDHAFRPFGLYWRSLRFVLTVTSSLITGFFAYHLAFLGTQFSQCLCVDVYVQGTSQAEHFSAFLEARNSEEHWGGDIYKTIAMEQLDPEGTVFMIVLHYCTWEPPAVVADQKLSCLFTWLSGSCLFIGYPALSLERLSIVSHSRVRLDSNERRQAFEQLKADARRSHCITLIPYHVNRDQHCGSSLTCPSVFRSSCDDMGFRVNFRDGAWVQDAATWWQNRVVHWNLGRMGCTPDREGIIFKVTSTTPPSRNIPRTIYLERLENALKDSTV